MQSRLERRCQRHRRLVPHNLYRNTESFLGHGRSCYKPSRCKQHRSHGQIILTLITYFNTNKPTNRFFFFLRRIQISFAGARITGAVGSTLTSIILRPSAHLETFKVSLHRGNSNDHGLSSGSFPGERKVRIHLASSTPAAALAASSTATVSSAARHFLFLSKEEKKENLRRE